MSQNGPAGVREQKRVQTRLRLAEVAAALALEAGAAGTTVDEIAGAADVGRATFFRYYDSKEFAIAAGMSHITNFFILSTLQELPSELSPIEALKAAHEALAVGYDDQHDFYLRQVRLTRESPAMEAWTVFTHSKFEPAYIDALSPRFCDLEPGDVRPEMLAGMNTVSIRLACDQYLRDEGRSRLPSLIQQRLAVIDIVSC